MVLLSLLIPLGLYGHKVRPKPCGFILSYQGRTFFRREGGARDLVTAKYIGSPLLPGDQLEVSERGTLRFYLEGDTIEWTKPDAAYPIPHKYSTETAQYIAFKADTVVAGRQKGPQPLRLRYPTPNCSVRAASLRIDTGGHGLSEARLTGAGIGTIELPIRRGVPEIDADMMEKVKSSAGSTITLDIVFRQGDRQAVPFVVLPPGEESAIAAAIAEFKDAPPLVRHLVAGKIFLDASLYREAADELSQAHRLAPQGIWVRRQYGQALTGAEDDLALETLGKGR